MTHVLQDDAVRVNDDQSNPEEKICSVTDGCLFYINIEMEENTLPSLVDTGASRSFISRSVAE